jgi:hypothetical protein
MVTGNNFFLDSGVGNMAPCPHFCLKHMENTVTYITVTSFPSRWPKFKLGSGHVGFVVDKAAQGQVFSEYFGFPASHSTDCSTFIVIHHHLRLLHTGLSNSGPGRYFQGLSQTYVENVLNSYLSRMSFILN